MWYVLLRQNIAFKPAQTALSPRAVRGVAQKAPDCALPQLPGKAVSNPLLLKTS